MSDKPQNNDFDIEKIMEGIGSGKAEPGGGTAGGSPPKEEFFLLSQEPVPDGPVKEAQPEFVPREKNLPAEGMPNKRGRKDKIRKAKSQNKDGDKSKVKKWLLRVFILVLLIAILLLVLKQCGVFDDKTPAPIVAGDLFPGANAQDGPLSNMSKEEILEQMQKEADKAYFSFKINTEIVFEDGKSAGNVGIENPNYNVYPMVVQIFLGKDGKGEMIYDSGGLLPNQHIDNAKLTKVLSTGTYEALAYLYAYDPETKVNIFKSTAELKIIIKN